MAKRVLCIDDDPDILDTMGYILISEGYEVRTLLSPEDIFRQIRHFKPDLITVDINLFNCNGLEVCRAISSNPDTRHIPVIVTSADDRIYSAKHDYGAADILLKPFGMNTLIETVGNFLLAKVVSFRTAS